MYEPGLDYFVDREIEAIWWWRGWIPPFIYIKYEVYTKYAMLYTLITAGAVQISDFL